MKRPVATLLFAFLGLAVTSLSATFLQGTEDRAARRHQAAERIGDRVKTADPGHLDPQLEGQLVRLEGMATAEGFVEDPETGVRAPGLLLSRVVEMWQWLEKTTDDGVVNEQGWSDTLVDSSAFADPEGHQNPETPRLPPLMMTNTVKVGEFVVPDKLVRSIQKRRPFEVTPAATAGPATLGATVHDGALVLASDPQAPQVGDLRVTYEVVEPLEVSLLGIQTGNTLSHVSDGSGPAYLVLKIEGQPLFPNLDSISPAQIWLYRGLALAGLGLGLGLMRQAMTERLRPGFVVVSLLALSVGCAVAAWQWPEHSMSRVWTFAGLAAGSLVLALLGLRRS